VSDVKRFVGLFDGRRDAAGLWSGGCSRMDVTDEMFGSHLLGTFVFGVYPLRDDGLVRWGCSDIDVDDFDAAMNLKTAFQVKGVRSWVERTSRGFHVWVFAAEWVTARVMRRAFLAAHTAIELPAKEVNPKQEEAKGLGNYVRLPYPGVLSGASERWMVSDSLTPIEFDVFLSEAEESVVSPAQLAALASLYEPKQKANLVGVVPAALQESEATVNAYIRHIWLNGPLPHQDRSNTLCYLAHLMREYGTPPKNAYAVLRDADKRWGKFHERVDCEEQLLRILEMAYSKVGV
jgi:hypothetical protein